MRRRYPNIIFVVRRRIGHYLSRGYEYWMYGKLLIDMERIGLRPFGDLYKPWGRFRQRVDRFAHNKVPGYRWLRHWWLCSGAFRVRCAVHRFDRLLEACVYSGPKDSSCSLKGDWMR